MQNRSSRWLASVFLILGLATIISCASPGPLVLPAGEDHRKPNDLSATLNSQGCYQQALEAANRSIEQNEDFAFAWNNKALALLGLGRPEEALAAVERSLQLKPDNAPAWSNKGVVLRSLGRLNDALEAAALAIELEPFNGVLWYNKACYFALLGRRESALGSLATALDLEPGLNERAAREEDMIRLWTDREFQKLIE